MLNALMRSSFHPPQLTKRGQQSIRISSTHTEEHHFVSLPNMERRGTRNGLTRNHNPETLETIIKEDLFNVPRTEISTIF
jgi:hypothetical protein